MKTDRHFPQLIRPPIASVTQFRCRNITLPPPNNQSNMALRWGIASAGKISHDFVNAVGTLPATDHRVVAVAARDQTKADEFAKLHAIDNAYEGYDKLARDPNVEVVYVGMLNPQHYEVALLMLNSGKHVLCEKPLSMNEKQVAALLAVAKERQLFLMEAIWSRLFPAYQFVRQQIRSGAIGQVLEVNVEFGFKISQVERLARKEMGGGTVLDLGVYVIQLSQWCFERKPDSVTAVGVLNDEGCDMSMRAELKYSDGGLARIATSALEEYNNVATIYGTKGTIRIPKFWCPTGLTAVDGSDNELDKEWPLPAAKHEFNYKNGAGMSYEAEEVRRCIRGGKTESDSVTHADSLVIAQIEDDIRKQIGVRYAADDE